MKVVFVAWQDPDDRHWRPVARLSFEGKSFRFVYTKGAKTANFVPFGRMDNLDLVYESDQLFPLFSNRLLPKNRPEYGEYLQWLNIPRDQDDPLVLLGRSGGIRGTDSLMVFPCPQPTSDGKYFLQFLSHGLRYLPAESLKLMAELKIGMQLFLMLDVQNTSDSLAIALRTDSPPVFLGYVPRYFAPDFRYLLESPSNNSVKVLVDRINVEAPIQLRLLCSITAQWPPDFRPCSGELYEPLAPLADKTCVQKELDSSK